MPSDININLHDAQAHFDFLDIPLMPANKLDADHYSATDIDGVTESIFGSGNMAYASLQASQTDAAMILNDALAPEPDHGSPDQESVLFSGNTNTLENIGADTFAPQPDREIPTATNSFTDSGGFSNPGTLVAEGNFSTATVGALGVSALSSDAGAFSSVLGIGLGDANNFDSSTGGDTVTNIISDPGQTIINTISQTVENITHLGDETINNVTNLGDQTIDTVTNLANNVIENMLQGDIQNVVNNISDSVHNEISTITSTINTEVSQITETVNNILQDTGVTDIVNQITDMTTNTLNTEIGSITDNINNILQDTGVTGIMSQATDVTNNITNMIGNTIHDATGDLLGDGGLAVHLAADTLGSLGTGLDIAVDDSIAGGISTNLVSDNVSSLVGDLTGLDVPLAEGAGINVGFDLLNTGDGTADGNDISLTGIDTPDIDLAPVEGIVGDIDIGIDIPTDLADPAALVAGVQDIVGSLGDIAPADPGEVLNILGGQGTDGSLDILTGDTELSRDVDADVNSILGAGGVDTADILPAQADDILGVAGAGDETSLADPDTLLAGLQGIVDSIGESVSAVTGDTGLGEALNTEVGNPVESIEDTLGINNDLNINDAISMLTSNDTAAAGDAGSILGGGQGDTNWTESTIDTASGLFDDLTNGTAGGTNALPEPAGTIAEGLGAIHIDPPHLGGHHGGLFG